MENNNNNLTSIATYIDFKKAFDTVNHRLLLRKLEKYGLGPKTQKLLTNYLSNRKQSTVINGVTSSIKPVLFGVPQGNVVGPQLFSIYINDVVDHVKDSKIQMYADDIVLYNSIDNNYDAFLQDLQSVAEWCQCNDLTMNIDKTKYQICPNNRHSNVDTIADNHKIHRSFKTCQTLSRSRNRQPSNYETTCKEYIKNWITQTTHVAPHKESVDHACCCIGIQICFPMST